MRLITVFLLLASLAPTLPSTGSAKEHTGIEFVRVWPTWRQADSFVRIREYFGGGEDTGRQTVLRSQPEDRTGFYFLARTRNEGTARPKVSFVLEVITPDSPLPKTYTFNTTLPSQGHVFNLGLTGQDWASENVQPVAWRLRLLDEQGGELVAKQSFLWSMPSSGER